MKTLCLVLACLVALTSAQEDCDASSCASTNVALKEAALTADPTRHYYLGGLFNVHEAGDDPYECGPLRNSGIINLEAFFWAINRYSAQVYTGNEVTVGGFGMDSCSREERAVENVYSFETCRTYYSNVSPRNTVAFVGPENSSQAIDVAKLTSDMKRTVVSPGAKSSELNDHDLYSFFLRTTPSVKAEVNAMVKLLRLKEIKYVQVLYKGVEGMDYKEQFEMLSMGHMCITQSNEISMSDSQITQTLLDSEATSVVLVFADPMYSRMVLNAVNNNPNAKNKFTFIGTSLWGKQTSVIKDLDVKAATFTVDTALYPNTGDVEAFWTHFLQMKPDTVSAITGANVNTYNPWFTEFWQDTFNCRIDIGTCDVANQNLADIILKDDEMVPFTLMAVDAIIKGTRAASILHCKSPYVCSDLLNIKVQRGSALYNNTLSASTGSQNYFMNATDVSTFFEKFRIHYVENGSYVDALRYNAQGDEFITYRDFALSSVCQNNPCVECNEVAPSTQAPVSSTTTAIPFNEELCRDLTETIWKDEYLSKWKQELLTQTFLPDQEFTGIWKNNQSRSDSDYNTRFEYGHDWIIALGVCAGLGIVCVLVFEIYILYKLMGTKIGKQWRTMWLGQLLLFGIFCAYLVCFAYLWIPTKVTCGITRFGVGVSYAMCFAVLLVKLMVLLTSKTSADTLLPGDIDSPNYLRGIYQFLMYLFIVGVQVVIAIQWLIMVPPDAVQVKSNNDESVWICNHYTWTLAHEDGWMNMPDFVRTNFENHLISLTYIMFLIFLTVVIAMKSHGIITNHRESVFIGISAGFSLPIFIAWGLVGGLNKNHAYAQEFGDACFAFGLLIVATLILFAMFLPKVRQLVNMGVEGIYLEDDRDTYYAGSVVMSPPSYKSRPSSVVYVNSNGYSEPVVIGDANTMHLKHPGSNYSAPVYVKRPESTIGTGSGKVLRMTGDLTGKHPRDNRKSTSEVGYGYAGSGYGTYRKARSESGETIRRAHSTQDLGAL